LSLIIVFKKLLGDNFSVISFLYKDLFSLKFETGYYFIKSKKNCGLGLYFNPCLKSSLTIVILVLSTSLAYRFIARNE